MKQAVEEWFMMLNTREKVLVMGGVVAAILILFWGFLWEPLRAERVTLQRQLEERERELQWMLMAKPKIKQAEIMRLSSKTPLQAVGNPSGVIEQALQKYSLKKGLKQMRGNQQVKVSLKEVEADKVMNFLGELETRYGLLISSLEIIPLNDKGAVNVNLQLSK